MEIKEFTKRELEIILGCVRRERDERVNTELESCIKNIIKENNTKEIDEKETDMICSSGYLGYVMDMMQTHNNLIYKIEETLYNKQ